MKNNRDFSMTMATTGVGASLVLALLDIEPKFTMFLAIFFILAAIYFQLKVMSNEPMD